jgi:glycosyltransferase involved in cell wall biosynthesis
MWKHICRNCSMAGIVVSAGRLPRVHLWRGTAVPWSPKSILLKSVLRRSRSLYALGAYTRNLLAGVRIDKEVVLDPPRIAIPPNNDRHRHQNGLPFSPFSPLHILSVGRLVSHKGHDVCIAACRLLARDDPPWRLTLVGSGPQEHRLKTLAERFGLADRITIKNNVDDEQLSDEYRNATLFVLSSRCVAKGTEGFGIVLLEAMAHGIPVIASRVGGVSEVLDEGKCGILVEPDDPKALADAIRRLALDGEERKLLVERGFERVREKYAWN